MIMLMQIATALASKYNGKRKISSFSIAPFT